MSITSTTNNAFFQQFVAYAEGGKIDTKKSLKNFEEAFHGWVKSQGDIKPAILAELTEYGRLGEGQLVNFVLHALKLPPNGENKERVLQSLKELEMAKKVNYITSESGARRGRGVGWEIVGRKTVNPPAISVEV